jgi:guanylate kinase
VVNQDFDRALAQLQSIICCQRLRTSRQQVELAQLLQDLLT